jgi:hypothetical protein
MRVPVRRAVAVPGGEGRRQLNGEPRRLDVPGGWSGWGGRLAALTAFGLGVVAAVATVAGQTRWEGPEVTRIAGSHGLHVGDSVAVIPLVVGAILAWWCLQRPSYQTIQLLVQEQAAEQDGTGREP